MIIQGAILAGALLFFGVIFVVASQVTPSLPTDDQLQTLSVLTMVSIAFAALAFVGGWLLYNSRFSGDRLKEAYANDLLDRAGNRLEATPAEKAVSLMRTALLIRTAMLEAAAFFGLVCLIVPASGGSLYSIPWIWINAAPLFVLATFVVTTFPTAGRLEDLFETKIRQS
jgi:hypothetical protein